MAARPDAPPSPGPHGPGESAILHGATQVAEMRRRLASLMNPEGPLGLSMALDLMEVRNPSAEQLEYAHLIAETHREGLHAASLFLARSDLVDLIHEAAPTMPDQELNDYDVIVPNGLVMFETPLPDSSGQPPLYPLHAMSWMTLEEGHPLLARRGGEGKTLLLTSYVATRDVAAEAYGAEAGGLVEGAPRWLPSSTVAWQFGSLIGEVYGQAPPEGKNTPGFFQRALAAFWTLTQQTKLTSSGTAPQGRPKDQRKARRQGVLDPAAPVSVVRLQRSVPALATPTGESDRVDAEGSGRRVSVRFPVRPFWRRQWYPSVGEHRHVLIMGHWRGPDDAPVVHGERVFLAMPPAPPKG